MDTIFTRTFHPVGQGAFYTERFISGSETFTAVYDCGSDSFGEKKMSMIINQTFLENEAIDVLFISHFHKDHISGIPLLKQRCKIKNVIIPLLDNDSKTLSKVSFFFDYGLASLELMDSPETFFGSDTNIIKVNKSQIKEESVDDIHLNKITRSLTINSGTKLFYQNSGDFKWFFIPYNYQIERRKETFERALSKYDLALSDIKNIDIIEKRKLDIRKAYNEVNRDINDHSLVLFSGDGLKEKKIIIYKYNCLFGRAVNGRGCLYLGDIDLNQSGIIDAIKKSLSYFPTISIIQIPHHGSIDNFNNDILSHEIKCGILSYGIRNRYSHPSISVVERMRIKEVFPLHVTERKESSVIQYFSSSQS